ncbi:MAG: glycosyl transferase family 9 [Mucilaginibacter sp.]|nr:glycosyl transferase family 9 [Mucilaginibacter sp.]
MKLPGDIQKIIIFRALQLGDMLCFIPAVRALKKAYPYAHITLAGLPWEKSLATRFHTYFDEFIWFPGYPGLPEQPLNPPEFSRFLATVQEQQFDLALQMQGNGFLVNPMVELFNAKITAGFYKPDYYRPNEEYFLEYPDYGSEVERHLRLMDFLGIEPDGTDLEFPLTAQDQSDFNQLNLPLKPKKYICIHPGSRSVLRQWPVQHFAAIADYCIREGFEAVITGTQDETEIVNKVISYMKYEAINTAGKTTLGTIGVLIKNAAALVSNCTGVSHMAAAFKTPSIIIRMDGESERWSPINKQLHHTINWIEESDYEDVLIKADALLHQLDQV